MRPWMRALFVHFLHHCMGDRRNSVYNSTYQEVKNRSIYTTTGLTNPPLITKNYFEHQRRHLKTKKISLRRCKGGFEVNKARFYAFAVLR